MIEENTTLHFASERRKRTTAGQLTKAYQRLPAVLKQLGYAGLRKGQDKIITSVMSGADTIGILPTSLGKTACYVVPTMCMQARTLIFSPLVSLMKDQVEGMQRQGLTAGQINSNVTAAENSMTRAAWESGELQFLLVAPERLTKQDFLQLMQRTRPNIVVIDEAHCTSTWGHSFRPAYAQIADFVEAVNPDTVLALTATATDHVLNDIRKILGLQQARTLIHMPRRKNLHLSSVDLPDDRGEAAALAINRQLLQLIREVEGPVIVYASSRKACEEMHQNLGGLIRGGSAVYHSEIEPGEKSMVQERFMDNSLKVMFATNAFGMGINKADIRGVIHRHPPGSLDALTQEIGRAGRDGKDSFCTLMNDPVGVRINHYHVDGNYPPEGLIRAVYNFLQRRCPSPEVELALTGDAIAEQMGVHAGDKRGVTAALGTLDHFKVVSRMEPRVRNASFQILGVPEDEDFNKVTQVVRRYGKERSDGYFDMPLETLVQECGRTQATINNWLKEMSKGGLVRYVPPFRGKTTRLVGNIERVNFDDLRMRRDHALSCIDDVEQYADTPDELKHSYLERYFGLSEPSSE